VKISLYVNEIEHAATAILNTLWAEMKRFEQLDAEIKKLEVVVKHNYQQALAWQESEDPEDVALGTGIYWRTYFDEDKERYHANEDREGLRQQIAVHRFSMDSMAGSLLQFGKQGISLAFNSPGNTAKPGRMIGSQRLPDVIWCGRNQSLHWEDGKFTKNTTTCFQLLTKEVCKNFSDFEKRNEGFHLLHHLGWTDFDKFKADLVSFE